MRGENLYNKSVEISIMVIYHSFICRVLLERQGNWESGATLDPLDHQVSKAFLALQVRKEPKEIPVLLVAQEKMDLLD